MRSVAVLREPGVGVVTRLWIPLALNWLMMAVEGPLLVGLLGRLPEPTANLAAFSVAFAIAMFVEAPVMMLLSAGAALTRDKLSYERLWRFATAMNLLLTGIIVFLALPGVFQVVNGKVWKLPAEVAQRVAGAIGLLIPWPAAIGYRRLWQGVLIRQGRSRLVAWGTVLRLVGVGVGATLALRLFPSWPGVWVAATALSTGVVTEMLAIRLWAAPYLKRLALPTVAPYAYPQILRFYFPLLLTSLLNVALTPLLTTLMARGQLPILSLAAYPAVTHTVFLFSCIGVAYQEVVIVLLGTRVERYLLPVARGIAVGTSGALLITAIPGIHEIWLGRVFALPREVLPLAHASLLIAAPMPAIVAYLAYAKGVFIWAHRTRLNLLAAIVELGSVFSLMSIGIWVLKLVGVYVAIGAVALARGISLLVFLPYARRLMRSQGRAL
ncbi:MAG: hypothetical protein N3A68_02275 [Bacteroidia bacterium]|jgi:Na+-driven multidrug efflux pump|nr:hypothetical protein [Bacteroidia bacterium]